MRASSLICLALFGAQIAQAQSYGSSGVQTVESVDVQSTALTIYPDNLALVRETRLIDVPAGVVDIQFFGVTDMIIPQSAVLEEFAGLRLEGNFDSDLITPAKLLSGSVGDKLTIRRLNPVTGKSDLVAAELVSAVPIEGRGGDITAVFSTVDGVEAYQCSGLAESILLSKLPEGLQSVPVLSTRVVTETSGPKEVTLTYLTRGLEWSADYRMDVASGKQEDKQEGSLLGWLTLKNETSKSFKDTQLSFVAGALNQVKIRGQFNNRRDGYRVSTCVQDSYVTIEYAVPQPLVKFTDGFAEDTIVVTASKRATVREATQENFGDYKLYRAPQAVSVNAHQTKQIAFLFKDEVEFEPLYSWTLSELDQFGDIQDLMENERPIYSRLTYEIDNDKGGALAVSLPRGSLRAMSQRQDGIDVFLGEGDVPNRPVGEPLDVKIADSFLVTALIYDTKEENKNVSAKVDLINATDREVNAEFDFDILNAVSVRLEQTGEKLRGEGRLYSFTIPAEGTVSFSVKGETP